MVGILYRWLLDDDMFPEEDSSEKEKEIQDEIDVLEEEADEETTLYDVVRKYACSISNLHLLKELTDRLPPDGPNGESPPSLKGD